MEMGEVCELRFLQSLTFRQQGNRPNFIRNPSFSDWHVVEGGWAGEQECIHSVQIQQRHSRALSIFPAVLLLPSVAASLQDPPCALTEQSLKP